MLDAEPERPRARDAGIVIGEEKPGPLNAITDVPGVRVGHCTVRTGDDVRTGVTIVFPHGGNVFREKVPGAIVVGNGFGKLAGFTQVEELGNIEAPIALTNTLDVGSVLGAMVALVLEQDGNQKVRSVNVVVGETNDGYLNDIRGRHVTAAQVREAWGAARTGPVTEGCVGAGTGTRCFAWKGGIGTASRVAGSYHVGVLVQSNFGGSLTVRGVPVHRHLQPPRAGSGKSNSTDKSPGKTDHDGSCMIVVATDAPLDARNLKRLGRRALAGMARTGASFSDGSGDYVIAFCTAESLRIRDDGRDTTGGEVLRNDRMSPLFTAVAEATEEAILNSLFRATTTKGRLGRTAHGLPIERVVELVK